MFISSSSSERNTNESPILICAWATLPSGASNMLIRSAPNALS